MTSTARMIEDLTLNITEEMHVAAPVHTTFDALLEQMGPYNETPEGKPLPMKIEPWPGGRWYRDLGGNDGHFWGVVQAIKRPGLLEITGPLFMSLAVVSNLQYRLTEVNGGTVIVLRHSAFGFIPDDYRGGITTGWKFIMAQAAKRAEAMSAVAAQVNPGRNYKENNS
jgi:uncharacterized protein YndB with AHSA1/START domain